MKRAVLLTILLLAAVTLLIARGYQSEPVPLVGSGNYVGQYHPWPGPLFRIYVGPPSVRGVAVPRAPWPARMLVLGDGGEGERASWAVPCRPEAMRHWWDEATGRYAVAVSYIGGCAEPDTTRFIPPA